MLAKNKNRFLLAVILAWGIFHTFAAFAESLSDLSVEALEDKQSETDTRNPFAPEKAGGKTNDTSTLILEGIISGPAANMALISGKLYREGDMIGVFKIQSIVMPKINLVYEETTHQLTLDNYMAPLTENGGAYEIGFQNAVMKDALKMLSAAGGFNIIAPDNLSGHVSLVFHQTSIKDALSSILRVNNLDYAEENQIIRVGKTDDFASGSNFGTQQFSLKYANAKTLLDTIKSHLSNKGTVTHDDRTNSLVIKDNQAVLDHVADLVRDLDKADTQVHIEGKIVDISKNFSRALGIQWGFSRANGRVLGFGNTSVGTVGIGGKPGIVNLPAENPTSGVGMSVGNILNNTNLDVQLSAAETNGDARIISQPSVTTVNNAPAKIRSGLKIYVKTLTNPQTGETGLKEIDTGIELTVTPQITSTDTIKMKIDAVESEADFSRTVDGVPSVIDNTASTTVLVRNGETTVIGGLMKIKKSNTNNSTPFISNVPVVGWLFKSKAKSSNDNELLIFITPRIVGPDHISTKMAEVAPLPVTPVKSRKTVKNRVRAAPADEETSAPEPRRSRDLKNKYQRM